MPSRGITFLRLGGMTWKIAFAVLACNHLALMWPFFFSVGKSNSVEPYLS